MADPRGPRRLFLSEDVRFGDTLLTAIAEETGSQWVLRDPSTALCAALSEVGPPLDLVLLDLPASSQDVLSALRFARTEAWVMRVPVLGISHADGAGLDLWQLRALGVVGLIARHALPEHVRFRINQVIFAGFEGRRYERAPCSIPIEVEAGAAIMDERAVTLSEGGMGLSSRRHLEPNTDVTLRFTLSSGEQLILAARVIHTRAVERPGARFEIGLFFVQVSDRARAAIREEVRRIMDVVAGEWLVPLPRPADPVPKPEADALGGVVRPTH